MKVWLYNFAVGSYWFLIGFFAIFNKKARQFTLGRRRYFPRLAKSFEGNKRPVAWFHCASLGEFEQGRPVMEAFKKSFPDHFILVTFFSPSGFEIRKNYPGADLVAYFPKDSASNAKKFLEITKPTVAFFVKYEFWFHFLEELKHKNILTLSISSIFRQDQLFFRTYGGFYRKAIYGFSHIFVQDEKSLSLLESIHIKWATLAGDTRFDRVKEICDNRKEIPEAKAFKGNSPVLVVGSSWKPDIEVIAKMYQNFAQPLKLIIAPHEIHEGNIRDIEKAFPNKKLVKYSEAGQHTDLSPFDIMVIDNIGMLSSLYQYGEYAYVGGAFGDGLHNILEPATYGIPVFFGPKFSKFKEAVDLTYLKGAFSINGSTEFLVQFRNIYEDENFRKKAGETNLRYIESNLGATQKIMDYCIEKLSGK